MLLEAGADDYVLLSCQPAELSARVGALFRRAHPARLKENQGPIISGELTLNPVTYEAFLDQERLGLTNIEFRMLYILVMNWGIVVPRQFLGKNLWVDHLDSYELIKKYIQKLRYKLGDDAREPRWIANVRGVGYRFVGPAPKPLDFSPTPYQEVG